MIPCSSTGWGDARGDHTAGPHRRQGTAVMYKKRPTVLYTVEGIESSRSTGTKFETRETFFANNFLTAGRKGREEREAVQETRFAAPLL